MMLTLARRSLFAFPLLSLSACGSSGVSGDSSLKGGVSGGSSGRRVRLSDFPSAHVETRDIDIWIPTNTDKPLRVIYAHDGDNLFDASRSYSGVPWGMDVAMLQLMQEGVEPAIIVGISSRPLRAREYQAASILPLLTPEVRQAIEYSCGGPLISDAYLRFIVDELKPYIDSQFNTRTGRDGTLMLGSSMGGLVSMEAMKTYPDVFGAIGCVSAHTLVFGPTSHDPDYHPPENAGDVLEAALKVYGADFPAPEGRRIWIDRGTEELDSLYGRFQDAFVSGLAQRGYETGRHLEAHIYDGTGHHEKWWAARVKAVLNFLLS